MNRELDEQSEINLSCKAPRIDQMRTQPITKDNLFILKLCMIIQQQCFIRSHLPAFFVTGFGGERHSLPNYMEREAFEKQVLIFERIYKNYGLNGTSLSYNFINML